MNIKDTFPTAQEVEIIRDKILKRKPNLTKKQATFEAEIELMGVIPESFNKMR